MSELKTLGLFMVTALAEIVGCYLPYLWLREGKTIWLLLPAALSLALFAWLLTLHPTASGYGGVCSGTFGDGHYYVRTEVYVIHNCL